MDPMTIMALVGAGSGLLKGVLSDGPRERQQRQLRAEYLRLSPWLHVDLPEVQQADPLGGALAGGLQGLSFGAANKDKLSGLLGQKEAGKEVAKATVAAKTEDADTGPNYINGAPTNPKAGAAIAVPSKDSPQPFQWDMNSILNPNGNVARRSPWSLMDDGSGRKAHYSFYA